MEETTLNTREIFEQIVALQKHMTESDESSLAHLTNALAMLDEEEGVDRRAQVAAVCDVFKTRELNHLKLLEFYEAMYKAAQKNPLG